MNLEKEHVRQFAAYLAARGREVSKILPPWVVQRQQHNKPHRKNARDPAKIFNEKKQQSTSRKEATSHRYKHLLSEPCAPTMYFVSFFKIPLEVFNLAEFLLMRKANLLIWPHFFTIDYLDFVDCQLLEMTRLYPACIEAVFQLRSYRAMMQGKVDILPQVSFFHLTGNFRVPKKFGEPSRQPPFFIINPPSVLDPRCPTLHSYSAPRTSFCLNPSRFSPPAFLPPPPKENPSPIVVRTDDIPPEFLPYKIEITRENNPFIKPKIAGKQRLIPTALLGLPWPDFPYPFPAGNFSAHPLQVHSISVREHLKNTNKRQSTNYSLAPTTPVVHQPRKRLLPREAHEQSKKMKDEFMIEDLL